MIKNIKIQCVRNISALDLHFGPGFNIFFGGNGSGKTSVLESIYYLSRGKSFRTSIANRIIQHQQDSLIIRGEISGSPTPLTAAIQRLRSGQRLIRLNDEDTQQIIHITQELPLQFIGTDSYRYFSDGPKERRQFLDWGLFHVEPSFLTTWQQFSKVLKQRNAALKAYLPIHEIQNWNKEYITLSDTLDGMRSHYVRQLSPIFEEILDLFIDAHDNVSRETSDGIKENIERIFSLDSSTCAEKEGKTHQLRYYRGWNKDKALEECLEEQLETDMSTGYTHAGPQRADLQLYCGKTPAQDHLSQGQQKLAAYALKLAQGQLLKNITGRAPIYLIDDLPSELDRGKQQRVYGLLKQLDAQVFVTCINREEVTNLLSEPKLQMFHVKHGSVHRHPIPA